MKKDPSVPAQQQVEDVKKQRLSSALRENLKRRKAAPRPKKPVQPPETQ